MINTSKEKKLKQLIEHSHNIAIFGHTSPDGDAIGAILGFGNILKKLNKNVSYFTPTEPKAIFDFISEIGQIKTEFDYGNYDTLIFLDFTSLQRISEFFDGHEEYFKNKTIIQIDHHLDKPEDWITLAIKDSDSISTCELIFEHTYQIWPEIYDKNIATHLYMGITTDSGNFQYEQDSIRTFSNALQLIKLGADKTTIIEQIYNKQPFKNILLLQRILQRITINNNFLYSYYLQEDLDELEIESTPHTKALSIMRSIKEADIILLMKTKDGILKGSFRSKGQYNCDQLANLFGGGGHHKAAGFSINIKNNFEETKNYILSKVNNLLQ